MAPIFGKRKKPDEVEEKEDVKPVIPGGPSRLPAKDAGSSTRMDKKPKINALVAAQP
jgi:hypothetical protein